MRLERSNVAVERKNAVETVDVGTLEHVGAMAAGALLLGIGMTRKGIGGSLARLGGMALFARGASGYKPFYRALGLTLPNGTTGASRRSIRVDSSVDVNRCASDLYYLWRDLENLPAFMSHLLSVKEIGTCQSHWIAKGPAGTTVQWDAQIVNDVPDKLIAWETVEGSSVDHAGSVHFDAIDDCRTRLRVTFRYDPPAQKMGAMLARILGEDPQREVDNDLRRFAKMIDGLNRAQDRVKML
jgi:uncharacterized membrane protein